MASMHSFVFTFLASVVIAGPAASFGVDDLQNALHLAGEDPGIVDGRMGPETRSALARVLARSGTSFSGTITAEHVRQLNEVIGYDYWSRPYRHRSNALVWDLQTSLQKLGLLRGAVTGTMNEATRRAIEDFGARFGRRPIDGRAGEPTRDLLRRVAFEAQRMPPSAPIVGYPNRRSAPAELDHPDFGIVEVGALSVRARRSADGATIVDVALGDLRMAAQPLAVSGSFSMILGTERARVIVTGGGTSGGSLELGASESLTQAAQALPGRERHLLAATCNAVRDPHFLHRIADDLPGSTRDLLRSSGLDALASLGATCRAALAETMLLFPEISYRIAPRSTQALEPEFAEETASTPNEATRVAEATPALPPTGSPSVRPNRPRTAAAASPLAAASGLGEIALAINTALAQALAERDQFARELDEARAMVARHADESAARPASAPPPPTADAGGGVPTLGDQLAAAHAALAETRAERDPLVRLAQARQGTAEIAEGEELRDLRLRLDAANAVIADLRQRTGTDFVSRDDHRRVQEQLDAANAVIADLRQRTGTDFVSRDDHRRVQEQLDAANAVIVDLRERSGTEYVPRDDHRRVQEQLDAANAVLAELRKERDALERTSRAQQASLARLERRVRDLEPQLEAANAVIAEMRSRIEDELVPREQLDAANAVIVDLRKEMHERHVTIDAYYEVRRQVDALNQAVANLVERSERLQTRWLDTQKIYDQFVAECREQRECARVMQLLN